MIPRILFAIHYLELGGAEMSLISLLNALDYTQCEVDLFVYSHRGELMSQIPQRVHLLPEIPAYAQIERPIKDVIRIRFYRIAWARLRGKRRYARYNRRNHPKDGSAVFSYVAQSVTPFLPTIAPEKEYDLAISFLAPHDIVLKKVRAKKKVAWIHTDYSQIDVNQSMELPVWASYDKIVSISPDVTRAFLEVFPSLEHKIVEIPNVLSPKLVRERSESISSEEMARKMPREKGVVNLLSVGRFSAAKNYDNVPDICRKKENPYPYMKACDIYVQPSRYEGTAVTVREAQILGKSVVVTDYPTAHSQVRDGQDGVIVPMDNEGCAKGITAIISDRTKQAGLSAFCLAHDYGNEAEAINTFSTL